MSMLTLERPLLPQGDSDVLLLLVAQNSLGNKHIQTALNHDLPDFKDQVLGSALFLCSNVWCLVVLDSNLHFNWLAFKKSLSYLVENEFHKIPNLSNVFLLEQQKAQLDNHWSELYSTMALLCGSLNKNFLKPPSNNVEH